MDKTNVAPSNIRFQRLLSLCALGLALGLLLSLASCRNPTVVAYEPYESPAARVPQDEYYSLQWHYEAIGMPGAWGVMANDQLGASFGRVEIAVVDTGLHPHSDQDDSADTLSDEGYDFYSSDSDPYVSGSADSHGNHVAGTIAADTAVPADQLGVSGIGWNKLRVTPLRIFDDTGQTASTANLARAILYAAGESVTDELGNDVQISIQISVINLSLGGGTSTAVYDAIQIAVESGLTVVAASGNTGAEGVLAPASYDNTIAVSATAVDDTLAYYSTTGQEVSFAAPGGSFYDDSNGDGIPEGAVLSLGPENGTDGQLDTVDGKVAGFELDESLQSGDGYWYRQGTSMATPHVAGVVGLLYSYAPNLNQDAVYAILANTAKDLGDPGHDEEFGHGLIDAEAALEYLINAGRDYPVQPRTLGGGGGSGDGISRAAVSSLAADGAGRNRGKRPSQRRGAILPEAGAELDATSIIVKLTERAEARRGVAAARSLAAGVDAAGAARIGGRLYRIDLRSGHGVEAAIRALGTHEDVEYVQPNYRYRLIE